jgi:DNA-binding CsgD family transcriptional regulator
MGLPLSQDLIYEAILDEEAFAELPQALADAAGGRSALLHWRHSHDGAEVLVHSRYFTDEIMRAYADHFAGDDLWMNTGLASGIRNQAIAMNTLVADDVFARSVMYNEFIRPMDDDTFRCLGIIFDTSFGVGALGIQRGRHHDVFDEDAVARINPYGTALRRMMAVRGELMAARTDRHAARSSFDSMELAILQVDGNGKLLDCNARADDLLKGHAGLRQIRGHVRASGNGDEPLRRAIALATDSASPEASVLSIGEAPLSVTVSPLVVPGVKRRALIMVKRPFGRQRDLDRHLMQLFGLSPAEAQVSISLAEGLSPADIAEQRQVAEGTVRVQVKTIMAKLGCRRQTQIAAAVLSLPPLRLA